MTKPSLLFPVEGVRRIVTHTLDAPSRQRGLDPTTQIPIDHRVPLVWMVSDCAEVFLMGSGLPRDTDHDYPYRCFAKGCDPAQSSHRQADDMRRAALCSDRVSGGDDFSLPCNGDDLKALLEAHPNANYLQIEVGDSFDMYGTVDQSCDFTLSCVTVQ